MDWKTLDFEATEWMGEERRRAMGDTRRVGKGWKSSERWGRGRQELFVPGRSDWLPKAHWLAGACTDGAGNLR